MTDAAPALPQPGDLFASRYRIANLLGKGGFGAVYQAHDTSLDRDVALKVLMRANDEQSLARFLREARASAALASEHVATVYEVGATGDGPYIVMELLRGCDLQDELDDRTRLPVADAVDHVLQAALGIAHAHARGIVHRDLKPRNLFLARRDDGTAVVKVLDFGIAKSSATDLTQTGTTLGTPRYMAPEQLRTARTVDARTDVWALGVVLYELVSGKPIFDGETATQLAVSIVVDPHVPLRTRDAALPAELEAVIDRCLAKEPGGRHRDVHQLALALAPFATDAGKALVSRIERALGDRASGANARSAAAAETIEVTPAGSTAAKQTRDTQLAGTKPVAGPSDRKRDDNRAAADTVASDTRRVGDDKRPGDDRRATADTVASDDKRASGDKRATADAVASDDKADALLRSDAASGTRDASKPGPPAPRDEIAARAPRTNRTTIVALLIAAVAITIAVAMWMRTPGSPSTVDAPRVATTTDTDATTATGSGATATDAVTATASDAVTATASDAVTATATDVVTTSDAVTATASDAATVVSDAATVAVTDARLRTDAPVAITDAAVRPPSDATRPGRAPQAEIDGIENLCLNRRSAPTFVVPNNDGPGSMQCGRMALLGCSGLARACKTRPITDTERQQCRDFADVLRNAEVCK